MRVARADRAARLAHGEIEGRAVAMLAPLDNIESHPISRPPSRQTPWLHDFIPLRFPRRPHTLAVTLALLAALVFPSACATTPAPGPAFAAAPEPSPSHARLYIFRIDPQSSLSSVELALDEQKQGHLRNGEYATFELTAGSHRVGLRQRGLAFVSWGWNGEMLRAKAGETIYLEVSVRMSAQPIPPGTGRDLEIAGRGSGSASENVFLQHRTRAEALERLAGTTLRLE